MTTTLTAELIYAAPVNLRDLGGVEIDAGTLQPGFAIRTDDLAIVTHEVADQLVADGLSAIIDLRSAHEVRITGRGPLASRAVTYHHIPLKVDISGDMNRETPLTHESMGESYIAMFELGASQLVTALNVIAYAPGATAFHCAAGRDRTGVLAAALLLVLGATDEAIVTDYARTGPNMPSIMERTRCVMGPMLAQLGFDPSKLQGESLLEGGMEVSMEMLLAHLHEQHGDPIAPLRAAGLSDDTIARLRTRALGELSVPQTAQAAA